MSLEDKNAVIYGAGGALPSWRAAAGDRAGRFEGAPYGSDDQNILPAKFLRTR